MQNARDEDEGHLRKVFHALDLDGNGEITVEELQQVRTTARAVDYNITP